MVLKYVKELFGDKVMEPLDYQDMVSGYLQYIKNKLFVSWLVPML